jgi:hypothetical protein
MAEIWVIDNGGDKESKIRRAESLFPEATVVVISTSSQIPESASDPFDLPADAKPRARSMSDDPFR